jgi:hypothetical protein
MRIATVIAAGSVAFLTVLAAPALAKNAETQKPEEKPVSSPCHAYQPQADGSLKEIPCQEVGAGKQTPRKATTHNTNQ